MSAEIYPASRIKRCRATKSDMATRRRRLLEIVQTEHPMTVRQAYYVAAVEKLVGKTEEDYDRIQTTLTDLRRDESIPYAWIRDEGRFVRQPFTVEGIVEALNQTRRQHRKTPWQFVDHYVQIWIEKNALLGVIEPVTKEYDVALMSTVGYSSISFLHQAAQTLKQCGCPIFVYQFGDLDPSGAHAAVVIERELRDFAPSADITFERIAITPAQIVQYGLQAALRDTKPTDPRYTWFCERYRDDPIIHGGRLSVELDAIRPSILRDLVRATIERHLPRPVLDDVNQQGEREKKYLGRLMDQHIANEIALHADYSQYGSDHADALLQLGAP
jgi:hypothetical protein